MLYSKNGQYPNLLPERIRMPDGSTRTDSSTYTDQDILLAGYVPVPNPPSFISSDEILEWTGTAWHVKRVDNKLFFPDLPDLN